MYKTATHSHFYLNPPLLAKLGQRQSALRFHSYLRPHFPTKLTQRTRKKRISIFSGHRGYAVSIICLCSLYSQNIVQALRSDGTKFTLLGNKWYFADTVGMSILAIALQREGSRALPCGTFGVLCCHGQRILQRVRVTTIISMAMGK